MRLYHTASGILLFLLIIDFAVAIPVPLQEKHHLPVDMAQVLEDTTTTLGKRGDPINKLVVVLEDHFSDPGSSVARPSSSSPLGPERELMDVDQPETPPKMSSPESLDSEYELMSVEKNGVGALSPAWSMMSDTDPELVGAHALTNPGPSTESNHILTDMGAPLSITMYPTWFHPDHGLMEAHAPQPNLGPNSRPSTEADSDHRLVAEEPPSVPGSPTGFDEDYEQAHPLPPSGPGSSSGFDEDYEHQAHPLSSSPGPAPPAEPDAEYEQQLAHPLSPSPSESDHETLYTAPSSPVSSVNGRGQSFSSLEDLQHTERQNEGFVS